MKEKINPGVAVAIIVVVVAVVAYFGFRAVNGSVPTPPPLPDMPRSDPNAVSKPQQAPGADSAMGPGAVKGPGSNAPSQPMAAPGMGGGSSTPMIGAPGGMTAPTPGGGR